jgi:hypothetical protein
MKLFKDYDDDNRTVSELSEHQTIKLYGGFGGGNTVVPIIRPKWDRRMVG